MNITIVGPGIMEIPPKGWGAVEILIDDYRNTLQGLGHTVNIINTQNREEIVSIENSLDSDFVHVEYDEFVDVIPYFKCSHIAITSQYGYLEQPNRWGDYRNIFSQFVNSDAHIFCLSSGIKETYLKHDVSPDRLHVIPNGVRGDLFSFNTISHHPTHSIYLGKIDYRKRQYLLQTVPNLYFAGNLADNRFNKDSPQYLGEWLKNDVYEHLTDYANLVLLSDGEAHPLVCMEAMCAGLGIVISEVASANLDLEKPFIDIVPNDKMNDISYIINIIQENRSKSLTMREDIRNYAIENFEWNKIVQKYYLPTIREIIYKRRHQNIDVANT